MLENPTSAAAPPAAADPAAAVKRYAPPNQRNRLNRRKSAERFDRSNSLHGSDLEKNQIPSSRGTGVIDHGDGGGSSFLNENSQPCYIALEGCCSSQAFELLNNRWAAAMHCLNDPSVDLSERPVMYSGSSGVAWGHFRPPHQLMAAAGGVGSPGSSIDFLSELHRLKHNFNVSSGI